MPAKKQLRKAVCVLAKNKANVHAVIKFIEYPQTPDCPRKVKISYDITGLQDGLHGFHIHEYGDLTEGCMSSCAHFNPYGVVHGGRHSKIRHVGDLGNIKSASKVAKGTFTDKIISLNPRTKCSIIGRCVVIHAHEDDLGQGNDKESRITGTAGKRVACGVIGFCK